MVGRLNQLLADSISIRDMYKKHHWQVSGPTFYQLHLLFDKHFDEQVGMVDTIAERIQLLGGVSIAMGGDVAEISQIQPPPRGREEVPVQISPLLQAHKIIMQQCHDIAEAADKAGDDGTNDMVVSDILRPNELQSWFHRPAPRRDAPRLPQITTHTHPTPGRPRAAGRLLLCDRTPCCM